MEIKKVASCLLATALRADAHDGEDFLDGAGDEGFVGLRKLLLARAALLDGEAVFAREREDDVARHALQDAAHRRGDDLAVFAEEEVAAHRLGYLALGRNVERLEIRLRRLGERDEAEKIVRALNERVGARYAVRLERDAVLHLVRGRLVDVLVEDDEEARMRECAVVVHVAARDVGLHYPVEALDLRPREPLADNLRELRYYLGGLDARALGAAREALEVLRHREGPALVYPYRFERADAALYDEVRHGQRAFRYRRVFTVVITNCHRNFLPSSVVA